MSSRTQSINLTFTVPRRHPTELRVVVEPREDPEKTGYHLTFPQYPISTFADFPNITAKIHALEDVGYAATYGWVQMVREAPGDWEFDPIPITADLNTPFVWFGPEAQLFDAPSKLVRNKLDWNCWSFLTYVEDSLLSKVVRPILAIEWGYDILEGGEVTIKLLKLLDVHDAWEQQRGLLEGKFDGWLFQPFDSSVNVEQMVS